MHQVGWRVAQLDGGYRAYRRQVVADLALLPAHFEWRAVCGLTGSGKSRLLRALSACGGQVLDLEALASHRGSVLGHLPDRPQPSQKLFESFVWDALRRFSRARPVYVEAESRKIGALRVPDALISAMWTSRCVVLDAPVHLRVALLKAEYEHFITDRLGHAQDYERSRMHLKNLTRFVRAVLETADLTKQSVIITSDHGNIEDLRTQSHTNNPVATLFFGPQRDSAQEMVKSLLDIVPAVRTMLKVE